MKMVKLAPLKYTILHVQDNRNTVKYVQSDLFSKVLVNVRL